MKISEEIELKISRLPSGFYDELNDFIDFLLEKNGKTMR